MSTKFDPQSVPISYTLNFAQVNLILEALAELPIKKAGEFHNAFRGVALQQIAAAEQAAGESEKVPELTEAVKGEAQPV